MGGVSGHLWHLTENPELTFGELKHILQLASAGQLEHATEKLDGQALHVTCDRGKLRVARNGSEIRSGGLSLEGLAAKFKGRGSVHDAFVTTFKVLQTAVHALGRDSSDVFGGRDRIVWYPIEIIYVENANVINYDKNSIVFHDTPIIVTDKKGVIVDEDPPPGVGVLASYADAMQSRIAEKNWNVQAPSLVALKALSDGHIIQNAIARIDGAMSNAGVDDSDTIGTYLVRAILDNELSIMGGDTGTKIALAAKLAGIPGAHKLVDIKKALPIKRDKELASALNKSKRSIISGHIEPIELAISDFAIELLRGMKSAFIADSEREIKRLRKELDTAIKAIEGSGNDAAMTILRKQLQKLQGSESISTPSEGVVFRFKGEFYKFTGAFAPVNQILGIFKYGRGKAIPPIRKESTIRKYVRECLT